MYLQHDVTNRCRAMHSGLAFDPKAENSVFHLGAWERAVRRPPSLGVRQVKVGPGIQVGAVRKVVTVIAA